MSERDEQSSRDQSPLDPDEPHTPAWFTFLGLGLFLLGGIFLLATGGDDESETGPADAMAEEPGAAADEAQPTGAPAAVADPHAGHDH